ncbi:helix-turn-helix domain-containing protein [Sutcliffiella horikoshii]|uniref:helix-turn-helix domain-containing protein n=1 Tax=Sutcliffiella horikoshii TaxID=79883 RepID=UPI00384E99CD
MKFGEFLKTKREGKNLSMNKLGELSGVSAMYISHLESGKREKPSPEVLMKLSEGLEESYENLMVVAGYMDADKQYEQEDKEWSLAEQKQEPPIYLDYLDSQRTFIYKDRSLTQEEKAKLKSLLEIVLKD